MALTWSKRAVGREASETASFFRALRQAAAAYRLASLRRRLDLPTMESGASSQKKKRYEELEAEVAGLRQENELLCKTNDSLKEENKELREALAAWEERVKVGELSRPSAARLPVSSALRPLKPPAPWMAHRR